VEAARSGDRVAFDQLVRLTYVDVYALARRLTRDPDDARDVVQDAYLRAYRSIGRFRGDAQFSTWMYRITANCASTYRDKRSRQRHEELVPERDDVDERPELGPEGRVLTVALRDRIERAIEGLPAKLRQVVVLREYHGFTHRDIADQLGISETAAKVRLHRARKRLQEDLVDVAGDEVVDDHSDAEAG
jgi:RNA polymerase sigma-70 factor (ECF subfamily)